MIAKSLTYAAVCLLLFQSVILENLSGCKWIQSDHLKCEVLRTVNELENLQSSYQKCNDYNQPQKKFEIVNSNVYTLDVTTLPPKFCNFKQISVISSNVGVVPAHAFIMNENVFEIDLSLNNIKNLDFMNRPFIELNRLIISHNKLQSVNFDILDKMRKLQELKLDHNKITRINEFSKSSYLEILDLSHNKIGYLQSNFIELFNRLDILQLHGNPIAYFEYPRTTSHILKRFSVTNVADLSNHRLENLPETEILQIVKDKIGRIESSTFLTHRNLKRLYLDNTTVGKLSYQAFRDSTLKYVGPSNHFYEKKDAIIFNFTGMSVQRISQNAFQMISPPSFYLILSFDNNQISKIVARTFFNLNLFSLNISSSGIVELEPRSFTELEFSECGQLDLSKNRIKKLKADVFHNLRDVGVINLASSSIEDIEVGAFNNIKMVCEGKLILSNNKIASLSPQLFKNVTHLRKLYLNQNLLQTIDAISLEGLVSLELLDLNSNLFAEISKKNFVLPPNLETLNIASNSIETLPENVGLKSLKRLDLHNNPLNTLDIEKLNLSNTIGWQFTELSKNTLTNFKNVQKLIVMDSCIETVQSMAFSETRALINLYFVNTTIKSLNDRAFESSKITYAGPYDRDESGYSVLDLSKLLLRGIGVEAFQNMNINQVKIILDNNNLTKICSRTFSNINNLHSIHIENSGLTELEANSFFNLSFESNFYNDRTINLRNNRIRILKTNTFRNINAIGCIDLSANVIEEIESTAFLNISTIKFSLLLNNNKIKTLSSKGFVEKIEIESLDLSHNLLTNLDGNEFRNILYLRTLNLENNLLESFNSSVLQFFKRISVILLSGNPVIQSSHIDDRLRARYISCNRLIDRYDCYFN